MLFMAKGQTAIERTARTGKYPASLSRKSFLFQLGPKFRFFQALINLHVQKFASPLLDREEENERVSLCTYLYNRLVKD